MPPNFSSKVPIFGLQVTMNHVTNLTFFLMVLMVVQLGTIPAFDQQKLAVFNVSNNTLEGKIPEKSVLQRFPSSSFDHNSELCGRPLNKPCLGEMEAPLSGVPTSSSSKELDVWSAILIGVAVVMIPCVVFLCVLCYNYKRCMNKETEKEGSKAMRTIRMQEKENKSRRSTGSSGRLVELEFFDEEKPTFDLDDLLRASAEMMGQGNLGTTYITTLDSSQIIVVKRLRCMHGVSKKEFVQQMQILGRMRHENIVQIISYYYSKDEKLVIYEHVSDLTLFELLHDNRGEGRVPLNWAARLSIVKGIARGLYYLHQSLPSHRSIPHANLKSSNVLILHNNHPKLTDFGLLPLISPANYSSKLAIGKTPEFSRGKKLTSKADVFCFGLILMEVITGQVPGDDEENLSEWVRAAASNEWSTDILDLEMVAEKEGHGEMLRLGEIALECTEFQPQMRPDMNELISRIDGIREISGGKS